MKPYFLGDNRFAIGRLLKLCKVYYVGGVRLKGSTNTPTEAYCTHLKVRNDNYIMKVISNMKMFVRPWTINDYGKLFMSYTLPYLTCLYHSSVLLPVQYSGKLKENLGILERTSHFAVLKISPVSFNK